MAIRSIRSWRSFFYTNRLKAFIPRVRIVVNGQIVSGIESVVSNEPNASQERKYIENGLFIIERYGIRFTTVGIEDIRGFLSPMTAQCRHRALTVMMSRRSVV